MMKKILRGRGVSGNLHNRFEKLSIHPEAYCNEPDGADDEAGRQTEFLRDHSRSVLTKNESPDIGAGYSINPYRGCEHGCVYCYARPTHEYLGFSAGLDFETKIMVKHDAPDLLENEFRKKSWLPQPVFFSGNTDCYQPVEKTLGITRKCLEVFLKYRNPVVVITKNSLVRRDADILKQLSDLNLAAVIVTITTLRAELQRTLEPRTSVPGRRLETIGYLSSLGIKTGVNIAPVIPGLTDDEIPEILRLASERGASVAAKVMLRLPHGVKELFEEWLRSEVPDRAAKVLGRLKQIHGGRLYDHTYGKRLTGEGVWAEMIEKVFEANCRRYGFGEGRFGLDRSRFIRDEDQYSFF